MKDEVLYLRAAGVDLGKKFLLACVRTPGAKRVGTWSLETERFGTTPAGIRRLLAWLLERQVEVVVLEATSDYWRHLYYTLQPHLNLMLVNPAHLKGIRGRKSDPSDAAFLARAGASGMVMGSFVPEREIRELRGLTRRRTELVTVRGQEAQRLEKELEDTGMKLSSVLSDITGAGGRAILSALIDGERDPGALAELAVRRARSKIGGADRGPGRAVHRTPRVHVPALPGGDRPPHLRGRPDRCPDHRATRPPGTRPERGRPRHHPRHRPRGRPDHHRRNRR